MAIATKRLQRKDLIQRIEFLEYALRTTIDRQKNCESILNLYIEMNKDDVKFTKFLDKKKKDGEHKQEEHKSS